MGAINSLSTGLTWGVVEIYHFYYRKSDKMKELQRLLDWTKDCCDTPIVCIKKELYIEHRPDRRQPLVNGNFIARIVSEDGLRCCLKVLTSGEVYFYYHQMDFKSASFIEDTDSIQQLIIKYPFCVVHNLLPEHLEWIPMDSSLYEPILISCFNQTFMSRDSEEVLVEISKGVCILPAKHMRGFMSISPDYNYLPIPNLEVNIIKPISITDTISGLDMASDFILTRDTYYPPLDLDDLDDGEEGKSKDEF